MRRLLIHIGCPKAASSTLQLDYFTNLDNVNYLGIYPKNNIGLDKKKSNHVNYDLIEPVKDFLSYVFTSGNNICEFNKQKISNSFFQILDNKKINILSSEKLMGVFHVPRDFEKKLKRVENILRMNEIEVQFLIIIRNQIDLLHSQYSDLPFNPKYCEYKYDYVKFSDWLNLCSHHYEYSLFDMLNYAKTVKTLNSVFPNPKINILLFEEFKNDNKKFQKRLFDLLKNDQTKFVDESHRNNGASFGHNLSRIILSIFSKYIPPLLKKRIKKEILMDLFSKILSLFFRNKFNVAMSDNDLSVIKNEFASSNRNLQKLFNLPLKKYNYPL